VNGSRSKGQTNHVIDQAVTESFLLPGHPIQVMTESYTISIRLVHALRILGHDPEYLALAIGLCPTCRTIDGFFQRRRRIIGYCSFHQVKWRSPARLLYAKLHSVPVCPMEPNTDIFATFEWVRPYLRAWDD